MALTLIKMFLLTLHLFLAINFLRESIGLFHLFIATLFLLLGYEILIGCIMELENIDVSFTIIGVDNIQLIKRVLFTEIQINLFHFFLWLSTVLHEFHITDTMSKNAFLFWQRANPTQVVPT